MERTPSQVDLARARTLTELSQRIESVERRHVARAVEPVSAGLPAPMQSLERCVLHEWLCCDEQRGRAWTPPILIFAHLAQCALASQPEALVIWIGHRIWPSPAALVCAAHASHALLDRSLLVDPTPEEKASGDGGERLWAIDLCLRSAAAAVVIADVSGMQLAHSRRLQLAAEAGAALALLARPNHEHAVLSAASMRWRIERARSPTVRPRWRVELVRCKGAKRANGKDANATLTVEHDRATGSLCVPADLADRSDQASTQPWPQHSARRTG